MPDDREPLRPLLSDFRRHLKARNKAPQTIKTYVETAEALIDFMEADGSTAYADALDGVSGGHRVIESWMVHLQSSPKKRRGEGLLSAGYVAKRYREGQQFCKWLTDVEEILKVTPYAKTSLPEVPEVLTPVLTVDQLKALLAVCKGTDFNHRRDEALVRLFIDTGSRADGIASLRLERPVAGDETESDLNFDSDTVRLVAKGRKTLIVPFGASTGEALRRYLRLRRRQSQAANTDAVWIGRKGRLTADGIRSVLDRRADEAGIPHVHPHMFRHTFAHLWLAAGGQPQDLKRITGWKSDQMLSRYAASTADERARDAHRRLGLADEL